jgi:RNA recognition motif-containing protein
MCSVVSFLFKFFFFLIPSSKCEADDLTKAFSQFGEVAEVIIPVQANGKKKGFGIVQFKSAVHAGEAIKQMNGTSLMGW